MKRNIVSRTLAGVAAAAISLGCFALGAGTAQAADAANTDATITLSGEVAGHTFKAYQLATFEKVKSDGTNITSMELATVADKADLIKATAEAAANEAGGVVPTRSRPCPPPTPATRPDGCPAGPAPPRARTTPPQSVCSPKSTSPPTASAIPPPP